MSKEKCDSHEDCMTQLSKHETLLNQYNKWMKDIASDIKELREQLIDRPSWFITILISTLSTISVALIVYIVTNAGAK